MTVIAVTASRTSPGATSLATGLALALSADYERSLLIEADPAGGVLSLRFDLDVTPSLTTFGSDIRNGYSHETVWRNTQDLRGTRCIPAPVDPRLARSWVERVTPQLVQYLPTIGAPVIIDLGWVGESGPSLELAAAADVTLIVTRPEIAEVQALLFQVRQLQAIGAPVGLVTVGTTPNDPQEVAAVAGVPLVAVLPDDPKVAAALRGAKFAPNKFRRSLLWRTIGGIASRLVDPAVMLARSSGPEADHGPAPVYDPAPVYNPAPVEAVRVEERVPVELAVPVQVARPSFTERYDVGDADLGGADLGGADLGGADLGGDLERAAEVDIDLTIDPDRFEVTKQLDETPEAELVLSTGERCRLDPHGATLIGRHGDCQIIIRDSQVSRRHGRLTRTVTGWHYADLGSRNGSVLNGRPCTDAVLSPGDELYIGHDRLTFEIIPTRVRQLRETESA